jgi:hypothetical protein
MITMEEAAKAVGLSDRQLRRRIEVCRPLLAPYIRRGDKNRVLLDHGAVQILRAVEDRRATGATLEAAMSYVADSISSEQGSELEPTSRQAEAASPDVAILRDVIEDLRRDRDEWRTLAIKLQDQRALPSPRRGIFGFFNRRKATAAV